MQVAMYTLHNHKCVDVVTSESPAPSEQW